MEKKTIAVLFGGRSSEHEVSCVSATTVIKNINQEYYNIVIVGITKEGKWMLVPSVDSIEDNTWESVGISAVISPDREQQALLIMENNKVKQCKLDVVFPVLHGLNGEDGTVQGLLELSGIPYVGCGVLASAVSMDKLYTKIIVDTLGVRQARYVAVNARELNQMMEVVKRVEDTLSYPVFIKPSNAGSSKGVSKAHNREELMEGLTGAAEHDHKILVEETIVGREIECAVLGGHEVRASGVGEILAAAEFYDYDAKYNNAESRTVISPKLADGVEAQIREDAVKIFKAVDGFGLARADFFVTKDTNEVVFNEINTLPGFTAISMYPMLWEAKGIAKQQLVEKLIQSAFTRNSK
ncbi:MAG: D-alanine--D-alanine ligase [Clostridiales bacterium]|nr:D-alanine--D-alanine ligase [Clostridiales bacterium]